jgi:glycosyltransferase involved in cell wall biosynthesis
MKLLIYCTSFFPAIGGTERVTFDLARGLAELTRDRTTNDAFTVTVVTQTPGNAVEEQSLPFNIVRQPRLRTLFSLVRSCDLLHLAGPAMTPLMIGLLVRKPTIMEHHGFQAVCPNGQFFYSPEHRMCDGYFMAGRIGKCIACNSPDLGTLGSAKMLCVTPFRRWLSNRVDVNITPTNWLASIVRLHGMTTIYHGSNPPAKCDKQKGSLIPTFAFQGRLVSTKGASVLLEAARQLRAAGAEFKLKIIGDGPERASLEGQAKSIADCVEFMGRVSDEELAEAYSDVSVVIVPSLAGEVFGLVAAESMSRGKALIVSDVGSLKEIAGDGGVVVKAGDAAQLSAAMGHFVENRSAVSIAGQRAKERAERVFDMEAMIRSHADLYQRVLRKCAGSVGAE